MYPPTAAEETPAATDHAGIAKREEVIERLDRELAESRATITDLQTQLSTRTIKTPKPRRAPKSACKSSRPIAQAQLDDLQKKLDAALAAVGHRPPARRGFGSG